MFGRKKKPKPGNLPPGAPHSRWRSPVFDPRGPMFDPLMWGASFDQINTGSVSLDARLADEAARLSPRLSGESFSFPCGSDGKTEGFRFEQQCQALTGNHPGNHECLWSHQRTVYRPVFQSQSLTTHLVEAREDLQNVYLSHLLAFHSPALVDARLEEMRTHVLEGGRLTIPKLPTAGEVAGDPEGKLGLPEEPEREKECSYCGMTSEEVMHIPCLIKAKEEGVENIFPVTEAWNRKQIEKMNAEFARGRTRGLSSTEHELLASGFTWEDIQKMRERRGEMSLTTDGNGGFYFTQPDGSIEKLPPDMVDDKGDGTYDLVLQAGFYPNGRGSPGSAGTVSQEIKVHVVTDGKKRRRNRESGGGQPMPF